MSRHFTIRSVRFFAVAVASLFAVVLWGCPKPLPEPPPVTSTEKPELFANPFVRGFITTIPGARAVQELATLDKGGPIGMYVPEVTVSLRETGTNRVVGKGQTDLSGRYHFAPVANGTYVVCWEMRGFVPGCAQPFRMDGRPMFHHLIRIAPDLRAYPLVLFGNIRLRDGELRLFEPLANLNVFAYARARVGGRVLDSAFVNTHGDYVLPMRSNRDNVLLEGVLEGLTEVATLTGELLQRSGTAHRADLVLNNNRPRAHLLTQVGGKNVRAVAPGAVVQLRASGEDIDGDPLNFRWILPEKAGSLTSSSGASVDWRLPNARGLHRVQLLVGDRRGGYARIEALITTDTAGVRFSGRVTATDAPIVAGASVEINGRTTVTDAGGRFNLSVNDTSRYVVNITKQGYNLVSRIYVNPVLDGTWQLTRGTTVSANPRNPIDVVDARRYQRCEGPVTMRLNWKDFPQAVRSRVIDSRSGRVALTRDQAPALLRERQRRECGPGARVQIPANALVDANGNAPAGNVDVTVFTVDLNSPDDMPGDYTAADRGGRPRAMESWGAAEVTVSAGGTPYNLRAGDTATLTIPIDPAQLSAAGADPPTIPLLRYDEKRGVWDEIGTMTRTGNNYIARVGHFTPFNADLLKVNQSCIQIHSPPSASGFPGLPANYRIEFTIPQGNNAPIVFDRQASNSPPYNVLINLPNNAEVIMVPYDPATLTPFGTFIVNSGGPQSPTNNPPDYDFSACQGHVTLYDVSEPTLGPDNFLHGLYSFNSINLKEISDADSIQWAVATDSYYRYVDPRQLRRTLNDFKSRHGFPTGETRVIYANSADLGFGRDMHCVRKPASDGGADDIACYVSNYGNAATPDTDDFTNAVNNNGLVATVAMEYSRIENDTGDPAGEYTDPERVVKFFVYGAGGGIIPAADLDQRGARPIPQLCLVCHGGSTNGIASAAPHAFPNRASVKLGSRFIAFDLSAYTIVDGVNPAFNKLAQQPNFKTLNTNIVKGTQPGLPIDELVDSMYLGGVANQREGFSILGWNGNGARRSMYQNVMGPSCRMCHASQPQSNLAGRDLRFSAASQVITLGSLVPTRVCIEHVMPHALVTHDTLWRSLAPHQPAQLQAFGTTQVSGGYGTSCGAPSLAPPTPTVPTYDGQMGTFFNARCGSSCHSGPKVAVTRNDACNNGFSVMASLLDLKDANDYNAIVGQPSVQAAPMNLITPSDTGQSYLWKKVNNGHLSVPNGCGVRMPAGGSLTPGELAQIREWILGGALKN